MRTVATVGLVLVCCTTAASQCVEVSSPETSKPSSKNARVTVLLDGKPVRQAKLSVRLPEGGGQRSFVTDSDGKAALNNLPEGTSCVTATAENNLSAELCLMVSARFADVDSFFSMALGPPLVSPHSFEDRVKRAEQFAPSQRLRKLAGTIADKTGAVIPGVEVQVFKRGEYPDKVLITFKTNQVGRFEQTLEPGIYTIVIRMFGFTGTFLEVEIAPDGSENELHKTLQVAVTDTCGVA
jgi:hypothetical protein